MRIPDFSDYLGQSQPLKKNSHFFFKPKCSLRYPPSKYGYSEKWSTDHINSLNIGGLNKLFDKFGRNCHLSYFLVLKLCLRSMRGAKSAWLPSMCRAKSALLPSMCGAKSANLLRTWMGAMQTLLRTWKGAMQYTLQPEVSNPSGSVVSTMFCKAKSEEKKN